MQRSIILGITSMVAIAFMATAPASAATTERTAERVAYADLNLDNEAGATAMLQRIRAAARDVCGNRFDRTQLQERGRVSRCTERAIENGVRRVDRPMLTALYYAREPHVTVASN